MFTLYTPECPFVYYQVFTNCNEDMELSTIGDRIFSILSHRLNHLLPDTTLSTLEGLPVKSLVNGFSNSSLSCVILWILYNFGHWILELYMYMKYSSVSKYGSCIPVLSRG